MHTQRFQKHDKNELLYLRGDDIALMTSSCTKNRIFAEKNVLDNGPTTCSNKGGCWFSAHDSAAHHHIFQNDRSLSYSDGDILMCQSFHNETVTLLVCKNVCKNLSLLLSNSLGGLVCTWQKSNMAAVWYSEWSLCQAYRCLTSLTGIQLNMTTLWYNWSAFTLRLT